MVVVVAVIVIVVTVEGRVLGGSFISCFKCVKVVGQEVEEFLVGCMNVGKLALGLLHLGVGEGEEEATGEN
jgi:hypothetical protein